MLLCAKVLERFVRRNKEIVNKGIRALCRVKNVNVNKVRTVK